jgi:hypothetical protein
MGFGTKGCEYNCGDECDGRCLPFKNEIKIPTHNPQTGELNPYYEELTGEPNPLSIIVSNVDNVELYSKIEHLIIAWNIDGTKTAGHLTRQIMKLIK